jgi:hypothetical protein
MNIRSPLSQQGLDRAPVCGAVRMLESSRHYLIRRDLGRYERLHSASCVGGQRQLENSHVNSQKPTTPALGFHIPGFRISQGVPGSTGVL